MKKKLFLLLCALLTSVGMWAQPDASTPEVGQVYYLYNPITKLFMTTNVDLPFVRPTGTAWRLEAAAGHDGWITLRLKDNNTEGCGYFWGKYWANDPAGNSSDWSDERVFKLVNTSGENYKFQSYAWGETTSYIYINNGNEGDRSYRLACNSHDQASLAEEFTEWQFISEEDYATYMSMDYTSRISNNDFLSGVDNWTLEGSGNKQAHGNTAIEYWNASAASGSFDYYQNLTNLPAGKYVLRAAMYNSTNGEGGASFEAPGQCGVYGTSNNVTKNANVSVDGTAYNIYTTEELLVPDGNLRLGFKNSATMTARWFGADWIQLTCTEYCLSTVAEDLPANGAMTAGKWYKYNVIFDGNYSITAATSANIIQTTDGTQMEESATGEAVVTGDLVPLTAGTTIYYKSSSDNTLVVAPASYSYEVSEASADVSYIQAGNTVTVSFTTSTNDPGATLSQNYSGVTFDGKQIDVVPGTNGFTFTVPADLTANTEYTLAIPANAIGYAAGATYNAAQNITLKTPFVLNGVYYLYNATNKLFLGRGANYGSRAVADKYGVAMTVATNANGISTFTFLDGGGNNKLFDANGGNLYTDNTTYPNFAFEATTGGCYVVNKNTTASSTYDGKLYIDGESKNVIVSTTNSTVWTLLTDAERDAIVDAYPTDNINTVITAAGISTTAAEFESFLATNYGATDKTDLIGTATFAGSVGDWAWTQVRGQDKQPAYGTDFAELWNATGTYSQTIENLPAGIYKLTVDGYERRATVDISNSLGDAGYNLVSSYLAANNEQVRLTDWYTTSKPGNTGAAVTAFEEGEATNELYIYLDGNTDLDIKLVKPNYVWDCWTIFNNFTLTYYEAKATPAEKTALADAISDAEAKTLGFEDGEYAPYNNVDALSKLAAAKAVDPETASGAAVVAATTALTGATWTANVGEQNAFYKGDFDGYAEDTTTPLDYTPNGWTPTANFRLMLTSVETYPGLADASAKIAPMSWSGGITYGEQAGYEMPLKANTIYRLQFKAAGWNNETRSGMSVSILNSTDGMALYNLGTPDRDIKGNETNVAGMTSYDIVFATGAAGNYVFHIQSGNNFVVTDFSITKAASQTLTFADDAFPTYAPGTYPSVKITRTLTAGKWATAVYPFAVSGVDNIAVLNSYSGETGEISFATAAASTANEPFLMRSTAGTTEISLSDVEVAATIANPVATKSVASLKGVYASGNVPESDEDNVRYVVSSNQLYKVDGEVSIKPFRAYFELTGANQGARPTLRFDDATGINTIEAAEAEDGALKDGKYIIDNKVVIVKNGVKYGANGQKLN